MCAENLSVRNSDLIGVCDSSLLQSNLCYNKNYNNYFLRLKYTRRLVDDTTTAYSSILFDPEQQGIIPNVNKIITGKLSLC